MRTPDPLEYMSIAFYGGPSTTVAAALFDHASDCIRSLMPEGLQGPWSEGSVSCVRSDGPPWTQNYKLRSSAVEALAAVSNVQGVTLDSIFAGHENPKRKFDAFLDHWSSIAWGVSQSQRVSGLAFSIRTSLLAHHVLPANNSEPAIASALHVLMNRFIDEWEPHYALVDVADWQHAGAGGRYEVRPPQVAWSHLQQQAETAVWNADEERQRDHVRGIYWGQLLNPRHLAKLGGIDAVRRELEEMGKGYYLTPKAKGYAFLQLGPGPMNSSVFGVRIPYFDAAVWYRRRIVEAGLLM
jgi:hypothetical protein